MGQPIRRIGNKKNRRRQRRRRRLLFLAAGSLLLAAAVLLSLCLIRPFRRGGASSRPPDIPAFESTFPSAAQTRPETAASSAASQAPPTGPAGSAAALYDAFFTDTAFIGDSRTEGLMLYTGLENATFYAYKGLNVSTYFTSKIIPSGQDRITIPEALKATSFKKIYIMLGINELGWAYDTVFIEQYGALVDNVKALQPDAVIYVQSILPVTKAKSDSDSIYNNAKIDSYNRLLMQMAAAKGAVYLRVGDAVGLDGGALPAPAAADGVHLNKEYCYKWLDYLMAHTAG